MNAAIILHRSIFSDVDSRIIVNRANQRQSRLSCEPWSKLPFGRTVLSRYKWYCSPCASPSSHSHHYITRASIASQGLFGKSTIRTGMANGNRITFAVPRMHRVYIDVARMTSASMKMRKLSLRRLDEAPHLLENIATSETAETRKSCRILCSLGSEKSAHFNYQPVH